MRILIADQQARIRYGLRVLLQQQGWTIAGEATDSGELVSLLNQYPADILLLDMSLPGTPAVALIPQIKASYPSLHIVSLGSSLDLSRMAAELGTDGYISKTNQPGKLVEILVKLDACCEADEAGKPWDESGSENIPGN